MFSCFSSPLLTACALLSPQVLRKHSISLQRIFYFYANLEGDRTVLDATLLVDDFVAMFKVSTTSLVLQHARCISLEPAFRATC